MTKPELDPKPDPKPVATQTLVYIGESPARNIAVPGGAIHVVRGEPFTVPDSLAKSLLEQDIYEPAPKARAAKES